jgi:hypothetical protein
MTQMTLLPDLPALSQPAVYFMTDGVRIKIGFTERPPRRRGGELKTEVIWHMPGDEVTERREHRRWAASRIGTTEWFEATPSLILWLALRVDRSDARAVAALEWVAHNVEARRAA